MPELILLALAAFLALVWIPEWRAARRRRKSRVDVHGRG